MYRERLAILSREIPTNMGDGPRFIQIQDIHGHLGWKCSKLIRSSVFPALAAVAQVLGLARNHK